MIFGIIVIICFLVVGECIGDNRKYIKELQDEINSLKRRLK